MPKVTLLSEITANKIAAGEVVERPASVVKELIENSLDAGAAHITVEIEKGGSDLIRISDNGHGMPREDAILSIERHATSKILNDDDLFSIKTFGFRGEALPSIASVSKFTMITREKDSESGTKIEISGGKVVNISETGSPAGTMIEVKNLYFNTPARRKFLKTVNTEMGHIADAVAAFALAFPDIQFHLIHNGRSIKHFSESDTLISRVGNVIGIDDVNDLYIVDSVENSFSKDKNLYITGYITKPLVSKHSSNNIRLFVNNRAISDRTLVSAIIKGYQGRIMKGQFPMAVLFLKIPFDEVDVNVHPAKLQVRFANQSLVFGSVINAVHHALYHGEKKEKENDFNLPDINANHQINDFNLPDINANHQISELLNNNIKNTFSIVDNNNSNNIEQKALFYEKSFVKDKELNQSALEHIKSEHILKQNNQKQPILDQADLQIPILEENLISSFRIIGQFLNSYIIAESNNTMILIDQHAADERVVYEKLKKRSQLFKPPSQNLLEPEIIQLNYKEAALLENIIPLIKNIGFDVEPFGGTTFVVKAVPALIDSCSVKSIIKDMAEIENTGTASENSGMTFAVLDEKNNGKISDTHNQWLDKILILTACHSAIRANHQLNLKEMEKLCEELEKCDNPYHCPHGRPTFLSFADKKEIEKKFKRTGQ